MRWLLVLLIVVLVGSALLALDLSFAPGVSVKNAFVYVVAAALVMRLAIEREFHIELAAMHAAFAVLIGYALVTSVIAATVIQYRGYELLTAAVSLKSNLIDPAIFFFAFFHGVRTLRDARTVAKAIALALAVANVFTITDVMGLTGFGVRIGTSGVVEGRVFGLFGHANDTAALIVCMLPAVIAFAASSRGIRRILWLAGALACAGVMIMTVSRGAFAGMFVGGVLGMYSCRRWLSPQQVVPWAAGALLLTVGLLLAVSAQVGDLLGERILGQTFSVDVGQATSGRTDIWSAAIARMASAPITLLTGFGWDVYATMPFRFAPHNHYLGLWFNLGIVGLGAFLVLLTQCIRVARTGLAAAADPTVRGQLIAFIFGILSLAVAVFFTDLTTPWLYIWAYIGVTMRMALLPHAEPHRERVPAKPLRWAA